MPKIKQKSYAIRQIKENQPSEEILDLIKIANFVPASVEIKGLIEFVESLDIQETKEIILLTGEAFRSKLESDGFLDRWLETIKPFPELYKWLMDCPPHLPRPPIHNLRFQFQHFDYVRQRLNEIVDYSEFYRERKGHLVRNSNPISSAALSVNEKGKIEISIDYVIEAVLGFDLARFKRCENCQKIIWAFRLNRKYCDVRCSNAFHQKRLRSSPTKNEKINERRRANRKYKLRNGEKK